MTPIRVILADDHPIVLAGIKTLLDAAVDIIVVGEAHDGGEALQLIAATRPAVAVIDISMPDLNGIDLAKAITKNIEGVKILVLTVHEDRAYVQRVLQAGARGYLLKRTAADELIRAIRAVSAGGLYLDPAVARMALPDSSPASRSAGENDVLSRREEDVLQLTARGFSNKEIGARLQIGTKSIETYKARAIEKLNLRTRADIVRYGIGQGWLDEMDRP